MATNTPNYNLVKQGENEFYDVEVVNENLDKIDTAIKQTKDIADSKASPSHTHAISDVSNLQTTLNNKANTSHTHTIANITNLQTTLDSKANSNDLTTLEATVTQHLAQKGQPNGYASLDANGKVPNTQLNISIVDASTTQKGIVQLNDTTDSTSTTQAATANAVKQAYDLAEQAFTQVSDGKDLIATAITDVGGSATSSDTFVDLAEAIGLLGGGIKNVQRGTTSYTGTSQNITIASTNVNKSIVKVYVSSGANLQSMYVLGQLTNATTLNISTVFSVGTAITIYWEVVEFEDNVTVQKGITNVNSTAPLNITISAIDTAKSMFLMSQKLDSNGTSNPYLVSGGITNSTTVTLSRGTANSLSTVVQWYVVSF